MYPTTPVDVCKVIHTSDRDGGLYELLNAGALLAPYFSANPQSFPSGCPYATPNSITQVGNSNLISIYPNPFDETITIHAGLMEQDNMKVAIFDVLGQIVRIIDFGIKTGSVEESINVSSLNAGIYLIQVSIGNINAQVKLIKNNI